MRYNMKRWIMSTMIMAIMLVAIVGTSSAATNLAVTPNNLNTLNSFTNSGAWYNVGANIYVLNWYGGGQYFEQPSQTIQTIAPALYSSKVTATIMCDLKGYYWGECVSMVKNLAHSTVLTENWYRGGRVTDGGISSGTTIARFTKWNSAQKRYVYNAGHAAIFREYTYDSSGRINGMMVWDQNRYTNKNGQGIVAMHIIPKTGRGGVDDASSYYVVQV